MNPPTTESINCPKPPERYEPMLKESIDHFLAEYRQGCSDFSSFGSIFFRLIQSMTDPPLEIIWFYSAATFHSSKSVFHDASKKVSTAKDLFQLLVSCSCPCNGLKRVAVLAPVVYELYNLVSDFSETDLCLKSEIEGLIEGIVSYISICCSDYSKENRNGSDDLMACFVDLTRVWTVGRIGESCTFGDDLRLFLPLVNDEVSRKVKMGCGLSYLAGIVMSEAFLLRLCLKFGLGVSREELQKDIQNCVLQTVSGFRSCYFSDELLRMLLEPSLPVATLLSYDDEVLIRKVLYDAVILVEYSFLHSWRWTQLCGNQLENLALTWALVADSAIQFVRENGDQARAISYINAFSKCHLHNQLIKWVNQTGMEEKISIPNISTPKALIEWFLVLEDQGVRVFDHSISKHLSKVVICKSRVDYELSEHKLDCRNQNENEGRGGDIVCEDQEMVDSVGDVIFAASWTVNLSATNGIRKRNEGTGDEEERCVKLVKYNPHENSVGERVLPFSEDDDLSSGSEVENPISDEDMEEMGI
ncbi:uncharacterized protein LOC132303714 [Cornus florida]|uniref:uncharacterized protein LOC132303714 n=1 Tax=Cornus florida TaxID=4283 RepID=UPI0028983FFC|nr:uncharacterized protein LOC132303714 [Cornus florida]